MRPVKAPETYMGVPVPEPLTNNWDTAEAYWWRTGVDTGLALPSQPMSPITVAQLQQQVTALRLRAEQVEEGRLVLTVAAARLRRGALAKVLRDRADEYETLARYAGGRA